MTGNAPQSQPQARSTVVDEAQQCLYELHIDGIGGENDVH